MRYAQARYADAADAHRVPAPAFRPGDLVFLDTRNIRTVRPCRKLDDKNAGPFEVLRAVGTRAYELDLPAEMDLRTRVFHSSLLELARRDPLPGQANAPPPPVVVRDHEEWLVDGILDSRWHRDTLQYRVSWTGHPDRTWEPWYHVRDNVLLPGYHARYPRRPGPMPPDARPPPGFELDGLTLRRSSASGGATVTGVAREAWRGGQETGLQGSSPAVTALVPWRARSASI
jgi:hypothetical protein